MGKRPSGNPSFNRFVMVGMNGVVAVSSDDTGNDGTWTSINPSSLSGVSMYGAASGNGVFASIGSQSGNTISIRSSDLTNFITTPNQIALDTLNWMCYDNGYFVGAHMNGGISVSDDAGISYSKPSNGTGTVNILRSIDAYNGTFIAVGDGNTIIRSTSPKTSWTTIASPLAASANLMCVKYIEQSNIWIITSSITGGSNNYLVSNDDGLSFTAASMPSTGSYYYKWLTAGPLGIVATKSSSMDMQYAYSPNGTNGSWTNFTVTSALTMNYSGGCSDVAFCIPRLNGTVGRSTNGTAFTAIPTSGTASFYAGIYA